MLLPRKVRSPPLRSCSGSSPSVALRSQAAAADTALRAESASRAGGSWEGNRRPLPLPQEEGYLPPGPEKPPAAPRHLPRPHPGPDGLSESSPPPPAPEALHTHPRPVPSRPVPATGGSRAERRSRPFLPCLPSLPQAGRLLLQRIQQQEGVLCRLVHVREGSVRPQVLVPRRGEGGRGHGAAPRGAARAGGRRRAARAARAPREEGRAAAGPSCGRHSQWEGAGWAPPRRVAGGSGVRRAARVAAVPVRMLVTLERQLPVEVLCSARLQRID